MIKVYINYPNPHCSIYTNINDQEIQKHHVSNQRKLKLNIETFQQIMSEFIQKRFDFRAEQGFNDVWLEIDFNDLGFEISIVNYILLQLGRKYLPFNAMKSSIY